MAGAQNVVIFDTKCVAEGKSDLGPIGFGSSNRPRIVNDASTVFGKFLSDFGMQFFVAGAVFGEVGG